MSEDEIILGLQCCKSFMCGKCPYFKYTNGRLDVCERKLLLDALNLIMTKKEEEKNVSK